MKRQFQLTEGVRHRFCGPVEIRSFAVDGTCSSVSGTTVDVSVYGLGVVIPVHIPVDTEVTVFVRGVEICGSAKVRHSQPCPAGFNMGLQFGQALFLQNIPGLDQILVDSFYSESNAMESPRASPRERIKALMAAASAMLLYFKRRRAARKPTQ